MTYHFSVFFPNNKNDGSNKNPFWAGIRWKNTALSTGFTRNVCVGIGPLPLGVVLVHLLTTAHSILLCIRGHVALAIALITI